MVLLEKPETFRGSINRFMSTDQAWDLIYVFHFLSISLKSGKLLHAG